ncbi:glycosyltransferase family 4 protein [Maridesulfovibrio sp.]|uniref:glycosyltransferase family 4 protein n=1 Tax=Maridesulfovibrio sp. TaxID=2795000 RepID=UPI0029C9FCFA|nr:glycosyltransferase family 4 protein [Maridesulfovibrio sp.]
MATQIIYLTPAGATLPSVRFRVLPFVELGNGKGLDVSWQRVPKSIFNRLVFFARLPKAEIYIIQAKLFSAQEISVLKHKCDMLVFDYDDAVWTMPPFDLANLKKRRKAAKCASRFANQCAKADLCIAGNRFLAEKGHHYQDNIAVIPTGLDTKKYVAGRNNRPNSVPVVGWMGTSSYLDWVQEPISKLQRHVGSIQFSIISNAQYTGEGKEHVKWAAWSSEKEVSQLQAMDIGLMPLENNEYTRGKCGFKILQYMACGVVPVAADVGFNAEIIEHGIDGFLVRTPEEWETYIMRLAEDNSLRQAMAEAARKKVVAEFDIRVMADSLWRALGV